MEQHGRQPMALVSNTYFRGIEESLTKKETELDDANEKLREKELALVCLQHNDDVNTPVFKISKVCFLALFISYGFMNIVFSLMDDKYPKVTSSGEICPKINGTYVDLLGKHNPAAGYLLSAAYAVSIVTAILSTTVALCSSGKMHIEKGNGLIRQLIVNGMAHFNNNCGSIALVSSIATVVMQRLYFSENGKYPPLVNGDPTQPVPDCYMNPDLTGRYFYNVLFGATVISYLAMVIGRIRKE
jgi:hypothetical protein